MQCEACLINEQTDLFTKCCKLFICDKCRQKFETNQKCICGKQGQKKLCINNTQLFSVIQDFYENRPIQCYRCQKDAQIQCKDCQMLFCKQCNDQIHNAKGFAKHIRTSYEIKSPRKAVERAKRRQEWCHQHKQPFQVFCDCGAMLCSICLKGHKDICTSKGLKLKSIKQYKQEYFSHILLKIRQITEYKQKLMKQKLCYIEHFDVQKDTYEAYQKNMVQQLEGLKKILQIKSLQIKNRLQEYWKTCQLIYKKNLFIIQYHLKKFDDYARLSQKFIQKMTGLDYIQRRVKKINVEYQFFNFQLGNVDELQRCIINMNTMSKQWENNTQSNILNNFENRDEKQILATKKTDLLGNVAPNSQFLLQCSQNPLQPRPLSLMASHNQIQYQFLHLPYHKQTYEVEYGVGLKMKGQQVFKGLQNTNGRGIIKNLNPSTKYRVRMKVCEGQWGPITQVKTYQIPKFSFQNSGYNIRHQIDHSSHSYMMKPGTMYGSNEISFGTHSWQIKVCPMKHLEEQTACISIGISNKQQKKPIFVGTTLNYGYQKQQIIVKITLNCEQNTLIINSSTGNQDQVYQNLPNFPVYPALQNKGNNPVQIQYSFF